MRLINAQKLTEGVFAFKEFFDDPPAYAILSHTWEEEEVTYQDALSARAPGMKGFSKIYETCCLALGYNIDFVWVDTCCIDKTSSAELTESINSMFRWYEKANVCFAFLSTLPKGDSTPLRAELAVCRWFTRGWTLQELIAPTVVEFFDSKWNFRGSKIDLQDAISDLTGVDISALRRERPLSAFSLAHRMGWASRRNTTRIEDTAYCLLGIFDVNMPLIYGEGHKAFRRLQEEIIKRSNDLTIFAWSPSRSSLYCSILAPSPAEFSHSTDVEPFEEMIGSEPEFALSNKGLLMSSSLWTFPVKYGEFEDEFILTFLELGSCPARNHVITGIFLRKVGPGFFFRDGRLPVRYLEKHPAGATRIRTTDFYISVDIPTKPGALDLTSLARVNFAVDNSVLISQWMPEEPWDNAHRLSFVSQRNFIQALRLRVPLPQGYGEVSVVAICDVSPQLSQPRFKIFSEISHETLARYLFRPKSFRAKIKVEDLRWKFPEVSDLTEHLVLQHRDKRFTIRAVKTLRVVPTVSVSQEIYCLGLEIAEGRTGLMEAEKHVRGLDQRRRRPSDRDDSLPAWRLS